MTRSFVGSWVQVPIVVRPTSEGNSDVSSSQSGCVFVRSRCLHLGRVHLLDCFGEGREIHCSSNTGSNEKASSGVNAHAGDHVERVPEEDRVIRAPAGSTAKKVVDSPDTLVTFADETQMLAVPDAANFLDDVAGWPGPPAPSWQ